jgi:hypothetical protein
MKYAHIYLTLYPVIWLGLFFDSKAFAKGFEHSQYITNFLVISAFVWIYFNSSKLIKELMLWGLLVALLGEVFFSIILGMYSYRLDNVPIYVPFGHAIIYASVFYLSKEPFIRKHQDKIVKILYWLMIIYSTLWLIFAKDLFGFLCTVTILFLFRHRYYSNSMLFFLIMFFTIVYLELLGTYYGCWSWPKVWFDKISFIPSANPPSGISVFYFAFDLGCLWFYKRFNKEKWLEAKKELSQ